MQFATCIAKFLDNFGRWREREAMMKQIGKLQIAGGEGLSKAEYLLLDRQGDTLLQQGRAAEAEALFRELLARLEAGAAYDAAYDHANTLMALGRCLAAQGRPAQAVAWHQRALEEFERLSASSEQAKLMMGACHADSADSLAVVGKFDEAQKHYEAALSVARELGDPRHIGATLGQLGNLALRRGDLREAARRHTEALETFRALGEPQMEAVVWHQLGLVAQMQAGRVGAQHAAPFWDEAERCYRQAVRIREQMGALPELAAGFNQLALVAEGAGRPADAERWYLRAIELGEQLGDRQGLAKRLNNLASLYLAQGRLDEAAGYARRAVDTVEQHGIQTEVWVIYGLLAQIAQARGRAAEAAQWQRKEQESYAAYAGSSHMMGQLQPLVEMVVAACQGSESARQQLEPLLEQLAGADATMRQLAQVFQRILAGERDEETLTANLGRGALLVSAILARLAGKAPPAPTPSTALRAGPVPSPARGGGESRAAGGESRAAAGEEAEGLSLEDLLGLVALAMQPGAPPGLGEQLGGLARALAHDTRLPPEIRALGGVLQALLSGERQPDLSALPPELAAAVRRVLPGVG